MDVEALEKELTLPAAVARFEGLRLRDSLADPPLNHDETLELLALGEVIARKSGYGRQLTVRSARTAGASWAAIGRALGTTRQSAWEAHQRWIDGQAAQHGEVGQLGFDEEEAAAARELAGPPLAE
ncbi:hypothetical protein [Petropleomorpha daqingensis]|uniref:Homeodomain-like domain-containing protein n=1 Tax=Petropleomorpha daqingensis TaxID=2026353 RepID=A0A853CG41_9ACTN|nr:hypothetical protein [Petropleomorpha daqingensis]NYJ06790.1 hypothetical protein [Petropleomorpha daqingensis]